MIGNVEVIIIDKDNYKREILLLPFMLHSKRNLSDIKKVFSDIENGKVIKLFFYQGWNDEEYAANLKQEYLPDNFKTDAILINYGQDFSKYYIGYLYVDFYNKSYTIPEDQKVRSDNLRDIGEILFDPNKETRYITIFTPTRPSDINLTRL